MLASMNPRTSDAKKRIMKLSPKLSSSIKGSRTPATSSSTVTSVIEKTNAESSIQTAQ